MTERTVTFGPQDAIHGILSIPDAPRPGATRAVLVANVGMHHKVGPFRLYVDLARAMARDGWLALRFDHLGMGESGARPRDGDAPSDESTDFVQAMDYLQREHGIEEAIVVALCSGVDGAHPFTVRDPRVRGAVFIDGYSYPTPGFLVRRVLHRGLQKRRWHRYIRRQLREMTSPPVAKNAIASVFDRVYPPRESFRRDIEAVTNRGTAVHFVFTGTVDQSFNDERQMTEMLGGGVRHERVTVTRLADADHVFTSVQARRDLVDRIRSWAQRIAPRVTR